MIPTQVIGIGQMGNFCFCGSVGSEENSSRYNLGQCPDCEEGIFWVRDAAWLL